ncbi:MAG: ABC transporter substrate-binding protein [Dehalococcoidia bacterium]
MRANDSGIGLKRGRPGRRRVLQGGLSLLAGSAAFALACGGGEDEDEAPSGAAQGTTAPAAGGETPKRGGVMLEMITSGLANNTNPVTNWWEGQGVSGLYVYDRLVNGRLGQDTAKEYILGAAQSVEQPDPTTIIFKLRPGMTFHNRAPVNGRAVTGDDVVKSQLFVKSEPAAQDSSFQNGSMQSVEAPDAQTVVFKLKAPNAYVFSATQLTYPQSTGIFPQELLGNLDTAWPTGSGPYELAEYNVNVRYRFKRFEGFREAAKGLPYIDEREVRIITDPTAQETAFRSEQTYIWGNVQPNTVADKVKRDLGDRIAMEEVQSLSPFPLIMNATKPPFNDVRVREAVYRFLNRQQFLDLLEGGRGVLPPGVLSVGLEAYQVDPKQTEQYWKQDLKESKQLLEAAGYDFNREYAMLTLNTPKNNQGGEIFAEQASQVGMKVRLRSPVTLGEWHHNMEIGDFDLAYAAMPSYDSPQKVLRFQHSNSLSAYKFTGPRNPDIDKMIDKSEQTLDQNERVKQVKEIQMALLEVYTPFFLTHNYTSYTGIWNYVKNYEVNPSSHSLPRTEMWLDKS